MSEQPTDERRYSQEHEQRKYILQLAYCEGKIRGDQEKVEQRKAEHRRQDASALACKDGCAYHNYQVHKPDVQETYDLSHGPERTGEQGKSSHGGSITHKGRRSVRFGVQNCGAPDALHRAASYCFRPRFHPAYGAVARTLSQSHSHSNPVYRHYLTMKRDE